MKYYWSCWFPYNELVDLGPRRIVGAAYTTYDGVYLRPLRRRFHEQEYMFESEDDSILVLAKLKFAPEKYKSRSIIEMGRRQFIRLHNRRKAAIPPDIADKIHQCIMDF